MDTTLGRVLLAATALLVGSSLSGAAAMTNQDVYPGLRRPPPNKISAGSSNSYDENYLSQILNFIDEQARRKFREKLKSYQSKPVMPMMEDEVGPMGEDWVEEDGGVDDFTFNMPSSSKDIPAIDEPFNFGVAPNDPRFYENARYEAQRGIGNPQLAADEEQLSSSSVEKNSNEAQGPYMTIKDPLIVNPKPDPNSFYKSKQMQGLLHKWGRNNNNNNVVPGFDSRLGVPAGLQGGQEVVQRPVNLTEQTSFSIYGVALIAGVSAAITIALIALGVGWWTFYKKSKAAQDVEYPAYGVTGPNKEKLSPTSGDRRLAQNAQMYHYQHQKQQIIAMENKMNEDRNGSLSDAEAAHSDDEEGDYTVYECPGLAPTGEMEVKNPLFFDDPTPATPTASNVSSASKAQPKASAPPAEGSVNKKNQKK